MGVRAKIKNVMGLGYQLQWRNGDIWFFGGVNQQGPQRYVTYMSFRKGGSVGIQRSQNLTTISSGSRSVSISTDTPGVSARITAPNGVTDIIQGAAGYTGEFKFDVKYPGNQKTVRLFYRNLKKSTILPGGGAYVGPDGTKFIAYQDAKQVAANSSLRYNYSIDTLGRVKSITDPNNKSISYDYTIPGQTKITNQDGKVSWDYYSNGQYIGGKDAAGFTNVVTRNAEHDVVSYRNERNQTWSYNRDANGDVTSSTNPLNQSTTFTYDQFGNVLNSTNALGQTISIAYEPTRGKVQSATNALGQQVFSATYDMYGQPLSVTDAAGRTSTMTYDQSTGDLLSTTSPEGLTSTAVYNSLGLPTSATAPGNKTTSIQYDSLSRVWKVTDPAGVQTTFTYDLNDNVTSVSGALNRTSTMTYDVMDNLITSTSPRGDTESYTYTVLGELKTVTNGRGKTRSYQYTARGELKYSYLPDGTTEFYGYLGDGNVANFTGSGRSQINYSYDNLGRLSIIDYPSMTDTTFTYDAAGRRISMTDTSGQTSWFYDAAGRLTSLNQAGKVTSYTYNADGSRATMTQPAGNTSYIYDQYGRLITMTNPFNEATQYLYDSIGRLHRKTLQPGMFEEYSYDGLDRLSQMKVVSPQGVVTRLESYAYNSASEVLSHTVDGVTTSYSYDASSQLTAESRPGYNVGYTFDGNGNRLTKTVNGVTENYTYDNGDKLLGAGLKTYQYDAAGRTTRIGNQVLTYDDEDRLVSYGGRTNVYNGFDTRVSSAVGGTNYSYHRDGSGVTAPLLSNSIQTFTPGISTRNGSTTSYQHGGLKDVSAISNSSGALTGSRVYDAYGATISTTGSWVAPFGYGGKYGYQEDGNGLQLLGHRYYDSSTGRFLTRDPIEDGRNWYVYCENNPVSLIDAEGLSANELDGPIGRGEARGKLPDGTLERYKKDPNFKKRMHDKIGKAKNKKKSGKPDKKGRTTNPNLTDEEIWDIARGLLEPVPESDPDFIGPRQSPDVKEWQKRRKEREQFDRYLREQIRKQPLILPGPVGAGRLLLPIIRRFIFGG